ncbi:MAG: acetylornithine aminotransferase [Candidatus Parcubacteria bacterium]|nr:MAG: acetylornithine aminotransferase [Candidatus Parcubacteria bacterium]
MSLSENYLLNLYLERNLEIIKGKECYLYDKHGNKYLDLMSNYGANILGYNNKILNRAAHQQINTLNNLHNSFLNPIRNKLAKKLLEKCNFDGKVLFLNSGAEAIDAALKFALYFSEKQGIIAMKNSYHGKTIGALSLTYEKKYKQKIENFLINVKFVDYGNLDDIQKNLDKQTGVIIIEPIQGDGGINIPPKGYLENLSQLCKENKIVLIIDEIQTGIGRTGKFLASQWENINPDIICLGKGIANGFPLSAVIVKNKIADIIPKFFQTSTFGGNLVSCNVALRVLEIINDNLLTEIKNKGDYLIQKLNLISNSLIKEIRGRGLIIGIELVDKRTFVLKKLQENFILAIPSGKNVIRLLPPYIIKFKDLDYFIEKFEKIIKNV